MKHKYCDMIKAWAEGSVIQFYDKGFRSWIDVDRPLWNENVEYRLKNKHQEFIDAEKEGKQIQFFDKGVNTWVDKRVGMNFFCDGFEYRIKPKPQKFDDPAKDIEDILDCFYFQRVKEVMTALDWTWWHTEGVPEIWDLRKKARFLLNEVAKNVVNRPEKSILPQLVGFMLQQRYMMMTLRFT